MLVTSRQTTHHEGELLALAAVTSLAQLSEHLSHFGFNSDGESFSGCLPRRSSRTLSRSASFAIRLHQGGLLGVVHRI